MKPQLLLYDGADFQADHVVFAFHDGKILMHGERLPTVAELKLNLKPKEPVFRLNEGWAISACDCGKSPPPGTAFKPLRAMFDLLPASLTQTASVGAQLVNWSVALNHCSQCGGGLQPSSKELAKHCAKCNKSFYPQVTPAIIVLVKRGCEILLARGPAPRTHFSCIAGFVEAGETLEEALRREVKEEVGIEVRDIKYFGSQPWPFPNNLMIGYTAEWVSGEIKIDDEELTAAGWYTKENLPELVNSKVSIARQMIAAALRS